MPSAEESLSPKGLPRPLAARLDPVPAEPGPRQTLQLLLVATKQHMASSDLRGLMHALRAEERVFEVSLEVADPSEQPELLELHRLVATPALIKLAPLPKQVFAGNTLGRQRHQPDLCTPGAERKARRHVCIAPPFATPVHSPA